MPNEESATIGAKDHNINEEETKLDEPDPKKISDTLKVAILNDASQWALENRERLHRARRNLMTFATLTVFVCIIGFTPQGFEAYGIKFDQLPDTIFFLFVAVVNIYLHWSYRNILNIAFSSRRLINYLYKDVICFNYLRTNFYENSKVSRVSYNLWRNILPTIACSLAVLSCFARIFILTT